MAAKKTRFGAKLMAAAEEKAAAAPPLKLRSWVHPEYGEHIPEVKTVLSTEFDCLYWDNLYALAVRKWTALYPLRPLPAMGYCLMWTPDDDRSWGGVPMLVMDVSTLDAKRRDALANSIQKTKTMAAVMDRDLYVSPFYEWELADYWEEGWYDK